MAAFVAKQMVGNKLSAVKGKNANIHIRTELVSAMSSSSVAIVPPP